MFTIFVRCEFDSLCGLEALDARRRLKVSDGAHLSAVNLMDTPTVEVSEGFARLYFGRQGTLFYGTIGLDELSADDVIERGQCVGFRPDLPAERVRELFVAAHAAGNVE